MAVKLSDLTSKNAVIDAIKECDKLGRKEFLKKYGYKYSRQYLLSYNNHFYDSKAIFGVAYGIQHDSPLLSKEFSGGIATVVPVLIKLGFQIVPPEHPSFTLKLGVVYTRKNLIELYGGQLQAGIWTPKEFPAIFIFSGKSGGKYGYSDGWTEDGVYRYTGEGQEGDMTFTGGNKAVRDHQSNGKELLLFEDIGKGKGVRYQGCFECASWELIQGKDKRKKDDREIIVFNLIPLTIISQVLETSPSVQVKPKKMLTLEEMRIAAYTAAKPEKVKKESKDVKRSWYERSEKVKSYVLARAKGICEACEAPAPFKKKDGSHYLEPHHTKRLSDEGPDRPDWVGAICPTCHRRIHSGEDGAIYNTHLQKKISLKEAPVQTK